MVILTQSVHQVVSDLLIELVSGELTDETIAAVDRIQQGDVPQPLKEVVAYMHGMSTHPPLRYVITTDLIRILGGELLEMVDERNKNRPPIQS